MRKRLIVAAIVAFVLLSFLGISLTRQMTAAYYGGPDHESFVEIPRGASSGVIADALKAGGALHYKLPFLFYVRWTGIARRLQAGEYRFSGPARPSEVARRLVQGDVFFRAITIPEGLTARETIALLARSGFAPSLT